MNITFDPAKDRINVDKHGLSLADAELLVWSEALAWPDIRRDYNEARFCALAPIASRLYSLYLLIVEGKDALSACVKRIEER